MQQVDEAVASAKSAFKDWSGQERTLILRDWARMVESHREDLALILCSEQGKPLHEARSEITQAANYLDWFAEEARRIYADNIPAPRRTQRIRVLHQPIGGCAAMTAWTFPSSMVARRIGAALAGGCTVMLAGLPRGVLSVLTGEGKAVTNAMVSNAGVRKVSFTGSIDGGKRLMGLCSATVKKVSLELGANCPFIVFDDADVDLAVKGAIDALPAFRAGCHMRKPIPGACGCVRRFRRATRGEGIGAHAGRWKGRGYADWATH
ncbi:acyl-CoA reductase-like NAD-dependent aldehyde dehydrogenase [Caballeronia udeis]|uniref:Acyl-CoA reductase-like NAD-dependent aldehyde dehydrogenase n=1 Tax=Caballeronia udeis TaxID=1232866 RepID=A0ABW8MX36_9BURK